MGKDGIHGLRRCLFCTATVKEEKGTAKKAIYVCTNLECGKKVTITVE